MILALRIGEEICSGTTMYVLFKYEVCAKLLLFGRHKRVLTWGEVES